MSESKPVVLRSAANPTVRRLVRMRDNRARRRAGRVLVDGWRETAQAMDAGLIACGIYLPESIENGLPIDRSDSSAPPRNNTDDPGDEPAVRRVIEQALASQKCTWVSASVMEKISYGKSARGVVAEFEEPRTSLEQLAIPPSPLILVLDRIEKPGNLGAVFRCADAAGVDAVLLCDSDDRFNPNAIRASLGCVFHVPSASGTEEELARFLSARSIRVVAARVESSQPLWSADLAGPLAIVLGSEAGGLGERWRAMGETVVQGVHIPMLGRIDSLNVSVSAAVIVFEAQRRRKTGPAGASPERSPG